MSAHRGDIQLTAEEQIEIFGSTAFGSEYADEAQERWGETDVWRQSRERVSMFTEQDWIDIKAKGDALLRALAAAKRTGVEPGCTEADDLADERFTRSYDAVEPGLAQFVHDIVVASYA